MKKHKGSKSIILGEHSYKKNAGDVTINSDSSSGLFFISHGLIKICNSKFAQLVGYKTNEIIDHKGISDFVHPEDISDFDSSLLNLINSKEDSAQTTVRILIKNKSFLKVKVYLSKTFSEDKLLLRGEVVEISESKTFEPQINILCQAVNKLNDAIILADLNRIIFYVNKTLSDLLGFSSLELIGKSVDDLLKECLAQSDFEKIILCSQTDNLSSEFIFCKKDGTHLLINFKSSALTDKKNSPMATLFVLNDVSDKDKMVGELRRKEFRFQNLFEKMNDAFAFVKIATDSQNKPTDIILIESNKRFEKLLQEPINSLAGESYVLKFDIFKDIEPNPFNLITNSVMKREDKRFEVEDLRTRRWYSISVYSPEKGFAFLIIHDITREKKAQSEVNNSKQMLSSIINNIPQRVFWKDVNSKFLGCNIHFAKDVGLTDPTEIVGKSEYDFTEQEIADRYIETDKSIIKNGKAINISDYEQLVNNGIEKIRVRLNKLPLRNEKNEIMGVVGTYEDISKQKKIEDNLRKLSQAVEQSPVSIVITDLNGNIEYVNQKFASVTGYSFQEVVGKNPKVLKSGKTSSEEYKLLWQTISSGKEWTGEFNNKKKNGELYWESASISPIKDNNGVITHYLAVKEDITEKKRAEEVLQENERLLREAQAITKLGSYVLDIPKNKWQSSPILDNIFGVDDQFDHSVEGWISIIHPEWRQIMTDYFSKQVLGLHERFDKEYKIIRKSDGAVRWVHGLGELEFNSMNEPIKMIGTIRDITESKLAEEALKDSYSLLEGTLESTVDGILVVDHKGKIQKFNSKFIEMWKIPESIIQTGNDDAALNHVLNQLKYPTQFINRVKELYQDTMAESIDQLEFTDGRIFERFSRPQLHGNQPVGRVWSFRDITDRKLAEKALLESEKKFRTLFETSKEGILSTDVNQMVTMVNPRMAELTGYTSDELMKMNFNLLIPPEEMEDHLAKMAEREKGISSTYERKLLKKDGRTIWVLVSATALKDNEGKYHGSFGMFTDISEQKLAEKELILAKEKAEEINRLKSIFLSNISHELRTPLIGIIGYAETLYNEIVNPDFKEMAYTLLKSGTRLKETLNLLLDLSHIEADKLNVNLSLQNLTKLVREKFKQFHSTAIEKGLKFRIILDEEDIEIQADERMLSQVIEHLLSNAIKFTNNGEVTVAITKVIENHNQFAIIRIKDTGIGIAKERVKLIFEPFRQASEGLTRSFEGIGLGLTVVKKFIELMGGDIYVESIVGKGSVFLVKLPIDVKTNITFKEGLSKINLTSKTTPHSCKYSSEVLLIEDDKATANIVRFYLGEICKTDWANNGKKAIEMASKKNYSAILVDINLGLGMDGIETINQIKKMNGYNSIPIIAVTAYALYGDRERFLKQGCTHYISKPFDKNDIIELVDKVLAQKQ